ncbi:MAG: hypothetical protein WBX15_19655 [Thermoanaerobaculia bacterium]
MTPDPPSGDTDRDLARKIFLLALVTCAWFFGGSGFNQGSNIDLTRAIIERHTLSIDPYIENTGDISVHGGHIYSNKAPGLSFLALVPYGLVHSIERLEGIDPGDPLVMTVNLYFVTVALCATAGAVIPAVLFLIGRFAGVSRRWSMIVALLVMFGTPLFPFSTVLFAHVPSALMLLLAYRDLFFRDRPRPFAAGAWIGVAGLTNYLCIPVAAIFAVAVAATREARWRRTALFILGGLPSVVLLGAYQYAAFGSFLRTSVEATDPRYLTRGALFGVLQLPNPEALYGITFSPYRGLFVFSPLLVLALAGAVLMLRRFRIAGTALWVIIFYFFLVNASFNGWHGGSSSGPRYLIPLIPLLGVALLFFASRLRPLWIGLGTAALLFNFAATAVDPQAQSTIRDPIRAYLGPALVHGRIPESETSVPAGIRMFYTGHVGINRVAADEVNPFERHRPGSLASEWASFNLGELAFGTGSAASVAPIVAWMLLGSIYLLQRGAREEAVGATEGS